VRYYFNKKKDPQEIVKKAKCSGEAKKTPGYYFFRNAQLTNHNYERDKLENFKVCENCWNYVNATCGDENYFNHRTKKIEKRDK
jgi:hypothetical protein